jgi:prepilin-type N-terminal cleavage/methylation domain-containing protein
MRHDNRGFTLIELLIVVVIISILAAIAIPKFRTTKEEAYMSKMKGDLRNLATAQEAYSPTMVHTTTGRFRRRRWSTTPPRASRWQWPT